MTPGEFRARIRYAKAGRLRWLSHLEVVHSIERCVRRADLPFAVTKGFSPHLKAAFGPALPVGTAGMNEYFDVWLTRYSEADALLARLRASSPVDLMPSEVRYVADSAPSLGAALTIALYDIEIDGEELAADRVGSAIGEIVAAGELTVVTKGKQKVFDLTRCLPKEAKVSECDGGVRVGLAIRMGPEGSLRPESLVRAALERCEIAPFAVRTTRLDALVETDEGVWLRPV
jgi:radical SAM-linked protein